MLDLQNDLNENQLQAVQHIHGPLLVIAGAGSGKTRVITYRIANLIENQGVRPWRVLAVTFTNKAAREMQQRVTTLLGGSGEKCWVSTFHSTCARLLRLHGELASVDATFTIYDDADQRAMVSRCLKELSIDEKRLPPRMFQHEINRAKQELVSAREYPSNDFLTERIKPVYELYEKRMRDASAFDFADLIYKTVRGMKDNAEMNRAITGRFDYILVDEFQDTNRVQLELVRLLTEPHGNICVVGDDDQSIYSWRGADVTNILDFDKHFNGTKTVILDRNYRSTAHILTGAHGVASRLLTRHEKKLWTPNNDGEKIILIAANDERQEARYVAQAITELQKDGYSLGKQAIFYRINAQSRVFEEIFRSMGIPYTIVGGMRFYERAEVKDILAYLRLIQNPNDFAAFQRIVNTPSRGIGKTTLERLGLLAIRHEVSVYHAIEKIEDELSASAQKKLRAFYEMVASWRAELNLGPLHLAGRVLSDTGYLEVLKAQDSAEADARLQNINELLVAIEDYEKDNQEETPSLESFLETVALQTDVDSANFDGEQVTLMTVHSAKGLEFDVVHVTGLEEDLFPFKRRSELDSSSTEQEEERRLCYVAMTRAKKRLLLYRALTRRLYGQARTTIASRFLSDIPREVLEDKTPRPTFVTSKDFRRTGPKGAKPYSTPSTASSRSGSRPVKNETWVDHSYDQSSSAGVLKPGSNVRHARFGTGRVIEVHDSARPRVDVDFPEWGIKRIIVDYLEPA